MRRTLSILLACTLTASAQQPAHVEPPVYVTAIDVVADVRDSAGKLPPGLTPADFVLLENGIERKIIGVDYMREERAAAAQSAPQPALEPGASAPASAPSASRVEQHPWQTVLYFETDLSNGRGRTRTAQEFSKHADKLVQMGTVDVIFANPRPKALLQNSRDAEAVRSALQTIAKSSGVNQLALHRREFLSYVQNSTQLNALETTDVPRFTVDSKGNFVKMPPPESKRKSNMTDYVTEVDIKIVRPLLEQEVQLIHRFRRHLVAWMSNYGRYAPRTLMLVTDGYDLDPLEYYSSHLNKGDELELKSYVHQAGLSDSSTKMATALATAGWTTVSVQGNSFSDGWIDDASTQGAGRLHKSTSAQPIGGPKSIFFRPMEPLRQVADETGGDVVANYSKIAQAIERIDDRLRITYQVDRKPDGKPLKIELRARDKNLKVRTARWAASATPDEMSEQRALGQLQEGGFTGDLPVEATVDWSANTARKQGTLRVVSKIPGLTQGDFRFTLAIQVPPNQAFVTNNHLAGFKLADGVFRFRTPLDLPPATSVVVITIEEMSTGMWGSSRIKVQ